MPYKIQQTLCLLGMSNRARSDIRTFAAGIRIHLDVRIVYVRAYCRIFVRIVLIMKDDGLADENVGWPPEYARTD